MEDKKIVRRSISLPKELDLKIEAMKNQYSYSVKNELIVELIEIGILRYIEDIELKNKINKLIDKVDILYDKLGIN